jgi:hypothetical protein
MRVRLVGWLVAACAALALVLPLDGRPPQAGASGKAKKKSTYQLPEELTPKLFTLQDNEVPLSRALSELARQTGNQVEDRRQAREEVKVKLDLKGVTFWPALEAIARAADVKISFSEQDGKLALSEGPYQLLPVSYQGLFRVAVRRIDAINDLESSTHQCLLYLQVAWEPRFRPLLLETQPDDLTVEDDKGHLLELPEGGKGMAPVGQRAAAEVRLRVTAPHRSAARLGVLKGTLSAMAPSKTLTFTLDKLTAIPKEGPVRKETQDGVTLQLRELRTEGGEGDAIWTVGILLEYPGEGPRFESFQSWLVNNEIYLEKEKDGLKQRFPPNLGYETDDSTENKALLRYRFGDEPEKRLTLGKPADWKLVYRTPGKIAQVPIAFEFKDVPLP